MTLPPDKTSPPPHPTVHFDGLGQGKLETYLQDLLQDVLLQPRIMHPDTPAPYLLPIKYQIIVLSADFVDLARLEIREVLKHGRCEGMVGRRVSALGEVLLVGIGECEEGELGHPEEVGFGRWSDRS
jgi:hypothetical protein